MIAIKTNIEKSDMKNITLSFIGILLFVLSTLVNAQASVSFSEKKVKVHAGDTFTLDIVMKDFPTIEGGGLVLEYNHKKLQVENVLVDGNVWQFSNKNGEIDNDEGEVTGILFSSYQGLTGNATIATVEFVAVKKGKSKLKLSESSENPFASNGEAIDVKFKRTKVRIRK